jgi:hypothetical protein
MHDQLLSFGLLIAFIVMAAIAVWSVEVPR